MGVLSHLRVIGIGSSAASSYCARLFEDLGADVQKVEPRRRPTSPGATHAWWPKRAVRIPEF